MKKTTTAILDDKLVLKIPGEKLPKTIEFSILDAKTRRAIIKAYNESTVYAPNLTATKSEKLSAAMSGQIKEYRSYLDELNTTPTKRNKAHAFCCGFEFDSIDTPNVVRLAQSLAEKENVGFLNIDTLIAILDHEHNIQVNPADLYNEFQSWKYYDLIKSSVGGVSIVKFMRFYTGLINQN